MRAKYIETKEGEEIYMISCECGSEFKSIIFRLTGKKECPTCGRKVDGRILYS